METYLPETVEYDTLISKVTPKLASIGLTVDKHGEVAVNNMYAKYHQIMHRSGYGKTTSISNKFKLLPEINPEYRKLALTTLPCGRATYGEQNTVIMGEYITPRHIERFAKELTSKHNKLLRKHGVPPTRTRTATTVNVALTLALGLGVPRLTQIPNRAYEFIRKNYTPDQVLLTLKTGYKGTDADDIKDMPVDWVCSMFNLDNPLTEEDPYDR